MIWLAGFVFATKENAFLFCFLEIICVAFLSMPPLTLYIRSDDKVELISRSWIYEFLAILTIGGKTLHKTESNIVFLEVYVPFTSRYI